MAGLVCCREGLLVQVCPSLLGTPQAAGMGPVTHTSKQQMRILLSVARARGCWAAYGGDRSLGHGQGCP